MKTLILNFPMPIITPRLVLRPPQLGDANKLNEAILESIDALKPFMPWAQASPSLDESKMYITQSIANWRDKNRAHPYLPVFVFDRKTDVFIGATGFSDYDLSIPYVELGYWIRSTAARQGLMSEAVNALTQYAFKQLKVTRVEIKCDFNNLFSQKLAERLNYPLKQLLTVKTDADAAKENAHSICLFVRHDLNNLPPCSVSW